jgi:uncharacterized membrane protein
MLESKRSWTDEEVEQVVGNLLRFGVTVAALLVLAGGVLYLVHHGSERAELVHRRSERAEKRVFPGEPPEWETIPGILHSALHGRGRGIILFGVLWLIATPVARVVFSVYAFFRQRDRTYVLVTLFVLAILLFSLFGGHF